MHGPFAPVIKINDDRLTPYLSLTRPGKFYTGNDPRDWDRYNRDRYDKNGNYINNVEMHERADVINIEPPEKHYHAELIDNEWWWVNGCQACNGRSRRFAFRECIQHDVCSICGKPRGHSGHKHVMGGGENGWFCVPCHETAELIRKTEAKARIGMEDIEHDFTSDIVCPYCGYTYCESHQYNHDDGDKITCDDCDSVFFVSIHHNVNYSTEKS
jgi:hypothetical protein